MVNPMRIAIVGAGALKLLSVQDPDGNGEALPDLADFEHDGAEPVLWTLVEDRDNPEFCP